jgi:hypothetical protein
MSKPGGNFGHGSGSTESADGAQEVNVCGNGERPKASLEICPESLNRIELWTVGRQVDGDTAGVADGVADPLPLVDVEVVHEDESARG